MVDKDLKNQIVKATFSRVKLFFIAYFSYKTMVYGRKMGFGIRQTWIHILQIMWIWISYSNFLSQ